MCGNPIELLSPVGAVFGAVSRQRKALRQQEATQKANLAAQAKLQGDAAKAEANARRTPNYGALFAQNAEKRGVASTVLTGAGGAGTGTLARSTLLGA